MDAKSIFALAVLAVIILAIIFNNNVKAKLRDLFKYQKRLTEQQS